MSSRAYTEAEIRKQFLDQLRAYVTYWNGLPDKTPKEKLEGLAFSICVMLDGGSALPGFRVIPSPHPDDRKFHQDEGSNWYPNDVDIAGSLHDEFFK